MSERLKVEVGCTSHCDEPYCDMGTAYYTCPHCKQEVRDYGDGWYKRYDEDKGFDCYECGKPLEREY